MPIARPAPTQTQQTDRDLTRTKHLTYSLPSTHKKKTTLPELPPVDEVHIFRRDLIRTILVAAFVLLLEVIAWWKFHQ